MSYKTLILVDNSDTLTTLNREIIAQTIRYILCNSSKDNSFAIASLSPKVSFLTDFDDSLETKVRSIDYLEYGEADVSYKDALMEVLSDWKENDFAGRDIILISDGHTTDNSYTTEELFFELNSNQYPVYVIECVQDNMADLKSLSSIARISKGGIFYTEFEGSDSSVEEQIGQKIFEQMKFNREKMEENYVNLSEGDNEEEMSEIQAELSEKIYVENDYSYDTYEMEGDAGIIYEMPENETNTFFPLIIPFAIVLSVIFVVLILISTNKKKREKAEEEKFIKSIKESFDEKKKNERGHIDTFRIDEYEDNLTRNLYEDVDDDDGGTRLLFQATDGLEITLEDRADPTKYFRTCVRDRIVLGRSSKLCDVILSYDDSVSSKHCELFLRGSELYVRDLNSSNGTYVNQQKVYQEIKLSSGDILKLGQLSLFVQIIRREAFAGF